MSVKINRNQRGFKTGAFEDLYGEKCSIQKSSAAQHTAIWLGISSPVPVIQVNGEWKEIELPPDAHINGRMHLSQEMVRELLPLLQHFANTGELPT